MKRKVSGVLMILVLSGVLLVQRCSSRQASPAVPGTNEYVGSMQCRNCHQSEYAGWIQSHHYMAMQPANDSTVLGNFDNARLVADGVESKFFKKDGQFYVNTQGEDGKNHDYRVKYTFGFTPLQQYLVEFPGGRMQATRVSWDSKKKKWFHQYAGQKIPAGDWLHWTGNGQNWNTMCAACHSTHLQKNYDEASDTYQTSFNEVNVACEACHGPGKFHLDYIAGADYAAGRRVRGSFLLLTHTDPQASQVNACGYCHARRSDITGSVHPGMESLNDYIPEIPTTDFFFADGQMKEEDYNYTSFLQSKMYRRGVQCSHCHDPHSGRLKLEGNKLCGQCHLPATYDVFSHTMHSTNSPGSACVSCHMPSRIYMGNDLRHDHSFRIPRPDLTEKYGTPNTCNSCHAGKTAAWAAENIRRNFGPARRYHFSEDLVPGSSLGQGSLAHLSRLLGDTASPAIVKAAAIAYLGRMRSDSGINTALQYLHSPSAQVRFRALEALSNIGPGEVSGLVLPLLGDSVRAVRIAAAEILISLPENQIPVEYLTAFYHAKAELESSIHFQADFALGNLKAGDFYKKINQPAQAEKYYRRALAKDNRLSLAMVNLASTLNEEGRNEEALQQLLAARKLEPSSDHVLYSLGLLYAEMKNIPLALQSFEEAARLHSENPRLYYNYGLLLQQQGKSKEAESVYLRGLGVDPSNGDILYALTIFYLQRKDMQKAMETAGQLKKFHGDNPNYQELLKQIHA